MLSSILEGKRDGAVAVIVPDGPAVTYGELRTSVDRAAGLLAGSGLELERPVSIALGNGLEFLIAFLAVARAGAVAAPLNPAYTADEFAYYVGDAASQMAVVPPGSPIINTLAPLSGNLQWVAYFDNATKSWSLYDPTGTFNPGLLPFFLGPPTDISAYAPLTSINTDHSYHWNLQQAATVKLSGKDYEFPEGYSVK